ncbi:MAG TPA: SPOR domain-containing protein [Puia sp.]|jgi:hypothetical protein|nr:SPOR domain-containing protein [Puia sp.]
MHKLLLFALIIGGMRVTAQVKDTAMRPVLLPVVIRVDSTNPVVIERDPRIEQLVRKQIEINEVTTRESRRFVQGFRIQVINSPDRAKVFDAKAKLYEQFPDWKSYLLYQSPNYKLRVGNFKTQEEVQDAMKQLSKLFPAGLYVIPDVIELKLSDLKADTTK